MTKSVATLRSERPTESRLVDSVGFPEHDLLGGSVGGGPVVSASQPRYLELRSTFGAQLISIGLMFYLHPFTMRIGSMTAGAPARQRD